MRPVFSNTSYFLCTKFFFFTHYTNFFWGRVYNLGPFFLFTSVCVYTKEGIVAQDEELSFFDQVDLVKSFCYLGDRLNASGGSEQQ